MKRTYKSGAAKRKETKSSQATVSKIPKLTVYFTQPVATTSTTTGDEQTQLDATEDKGTANDVVTVPVPDYIY